LSINSSGVCTWIQNSDTFTLIGNGSDWYQKWSDGSLFFQTDEGTNTDTRVYIKGKGTGNGQLYVCGDVDYETITLLCSGQQARCDLGSAITEFVVNEYGYDINTRIESSGNTHMLWVDAGSNRVAIGTNVAAATLHVAGDQWIRNSGATLYWRIVRLCSICFVDLE
jgi:hypothetical protein